MHTIKHVIPVVSPDFYSLSDFKAWLIPQNDAKISFISGVTTTFLLLNINLNDASVQNSTQYQFTKSSLDHWFLGIILTSEFNHN